MGSDPRPTPHSIAGDQHGAFPNNAGLQLPVGPSLPQKVIH